MEHNPVGWFEIYVQQMDRARAFYEDVFQLQLEQLDTPDVEMWAFPMRADAIGCSGALVTLPDYPSGGNSTLVYFSCKDCAIEQARALDAGGTVQRAKTAIGDYGFISLVLDTEGNMIGLHSHQ